MQLYDFQEKGLERTSGKDHIALFWDMGLGKTVAGTEALKRFNGKFNLLICQKSKIKDWQEHLIWNTPYGVAVINPNQSAEAIRVLFSSAYMNSKSIVVIVNYELLWRRPVLVNMKWDAIMLDESSTIQNDKTKACNAVLDIDYKHCILLSGTPCSGKYENLWSQAQLLGWKISKSAFDSTYVNWEKFFIGAAAHWRPNRENPYKNVERLKAKFREHGADFLKTDEVLELPEQIIQTIPISRVDNYGLFKKERYIEFGEKELKGDSIMALRIGLRKLCAEFSPYKNQCVCDLLSSSHERFVIFYNWNTELAILKQICTDLEKPVAMINGDEKNLDNYTTESNSVTLVQYKAGAMGLNLQEAKRVIYYSLPEQSDLFEQSKKRIHRIGQKSTCFYYIPLTEASIEKSIYRCLEERRDYTDELFRKEVGYEAHK